MLYTNTASTQFNPTYICVHDMSDEKLQPYTQISPQLALLCGYQKPTALLGKSNFDIKTPVSEQAEKFNQENTSVLLKRKTSCYVGLYSGYQNTEQFAWLYERRPVIHLHKPYVIFNGMIIPENALKQMLLSLTSDDKPFLSIQNFKNKSYEIIDADTQSTLTAKNLTPREHECLYYTIRGKSAKTVAKILEISPKTVEFHISNIKAKFKVHSRESLIEYAIDSGYLFKLPTSVLTRIS